MFQRPGKVAELGTDADGKPLREGSRVTGPLDESPGQLLAQLDNRANHETIKIQQARVAQADEAVKSAQAAESATQNDYDLAKSRYERAVELQETAGTIADEEFEKRRTAYLNSMASRTSSRAQLNIAETQVQAARAELKQAEIAVEHSRIHAPFDGIVTYLNIRTGDLVNPDSVNQTDERTLLKSAAMVLIDPSVFEITLELPVFDGELVEPG